LAHQLLIFLQNATSNTRHTKGIFMNKKVLGLVISSALISASSVVLAGPCTTIDAQGPYLGTASTDDVKLGGVDSNACVLSAANPHAGANGTTSGFDTVLAFGGGWSMLAGFGDTGILDKGPNVIGGVNFTYGFTGAGGTGGTWTLTADKTVSSIDLVFAMHASDRSTSFLFDNHAFTQNLTQNGTWAIEWFNNSKKNNPNYSNLVIFARDAVTPPPPPPPEVPEPGMLFLLGSSLLGLGLAKKRKA
jgi:hypothetical protein